jgi:hypothetical protein
MWTGLPSLSCLHAGVRKEEDLTAIIEMGKGDAAGRRVSKCLCRGVP